MKTVNLGICGLGTVGGGTLNILRRNSAQIVGRTKIQFDIAKIAARSNRKGCDLDGIAVVDDVFLVAADPNVDIVVELIGGTGIAYDLVLTAIQNGKHVVTANKALIAEHGDEIFAAAQSKGVMVAYEAAVAGGIPIIKMLREGLAGNRINWIAGIINGTTNYILSEMASKGRQFLELLGEAQAKGYAEADPTFDVEGIDAAHKLVILASIAFGMPLSIEGIFTEGIAEIEPVDIAYARELGYVIKHLGIARRTDAGIELRVHPTLVPHKSLISEVDGVLNGVMVNADAVGTTLYYGAGAGAEPTASAVVADIIDVARRLQCAPESWVPALGYSSEAIRERQILDIQQVDTSFYIRFSALDKPGVLSSVTRIMGDEGISIEAIIQREQPAGEEYVDVIILTNVTRESLLDEAVIRIEQLDSVRDSVTYIRVEHLDQ